MNAWKEDCQQYLAEISGLRARGLEEQRAATQCVETSTVTTQIDEPQSIEITNKADQQLNSNDHDQSNNLIAPQSLLCPTSARCPGLVADTERWLAYSWPLLVHALTVSFPANSGPSTTDYGDFLDEGGWNCVIETLNLTVEAAAADKERRLEIAPLLEILEGWLLYRVNSFDDQLGVLPLLVYFLCERDRTSVDIQWQWQTSMRLKQFLEPLFELFVHLTPPTMGGRQRELSKRLLNVLRSVLLEFPPFRVTPSVYWLFSQRERMEPFLEAARRLISEDDLETNHMVASLIHSMLTLGLGREFIHLFVPVPILSAVNAGLNPDKRCSCGFCEMVRRARAAVRTRAQLGILDSAEPAVRAMHQLLRSGVLDVFEDLLEALAGQDATEPFPDAELVLDDRTFYAVMESYSLLACLEGQSLDGLITPRCRAALRCVLARLRGVSFRLGYMGPGARALICVVGCYCLEQMLKDPEWSSKSDAQEPIYLRKFLVESEECLLALRKEQQSETDSVQEIFHWLPLHLLLLFTDFMASRKLIAPEVPEADRTVDCFSCMWDQQDILRHVRAVEAWCDRFQEIAPREKLEAGRLGNMVQKERFFCIIASAMVVCNGFEWAHTSDARKAILPSASPVCGLLLSSLRRMEELYKELFRSEGCSQIKGMLGCALLRAERAAALMPTKLKEWVDLKPREWVDLGHEEWFSETENYLMVGGH